MEKTKVPEDEFVEYLLFKLKERFGLLLHQINDIEDQQYAEIKSRL